jgi:hypothetical protein
MENPLQVFINFEEMEMKILDTVEKSFDDVLEKFKSQLDISEETFKKLAKMGDAGEKETEGLLQNLKEHPEFLPSMISYDRYVYLFGLYKGLKQLEERVKEKVADRIGKEKSKVGAMIMATNSRVFVKVDAAVADGGKHLLEVRENFKKIARARGGYKRKSGGKDDAEKK